MRVRWTSDAADDLERIVDYIAEDRPETARRIALEIVQSVDALDTFPNRGRLGRVEGTRSLCSSLFRSSQFTKSANKRCGCSEYCTVRSNGRFLRARSISDHERSAACRRLTE